MNTDMIWQTRSTSTEQTEQLAAAIGSKLRGGEVIELISDLGGGKTTFTRGLARGAGSDAQVNSPTFTISREYPAPGFTIAHFDFYRLGEAGIVADEVAELVGDPLYIVVIEWGEVVQDVLPHRRLTVRIDLDPSDDMARSIAVAYPEEYGYLMEGLA